MGDRKTVKKTFSCYRCCILAKEDRKKKAGIAVGVVFFQSSWYFNFAVALARIQSVATQ